MSIYITQSPKYCVYLTIYSGDKMPPFYIGSGTIRKIKNKNDPYYGSVTSKKYSKIWRQELKDNPHLFRTIILYTFYSRKNTTYHERLLQRHFNVIKSDKFINMAIASKNFGDGTKHTPETLELFSKQRKGKTNRAIPVIINGITYSSKKAAKKELNLNQRSLDRILKGLELRKRGAQLENKGGAVCCCKKVTINDITYPSHKEAMKQLNLTFYHFRQLLKTLK